jgi:hypothetical protein
VAPPRDYVRVSVCANLHLALAVVASSMVVVSLVLDDVTAAPLYAVLTYELWRPDTWRGA